MKVINLALGLTGLLVLPVCWAIVVKVLVELGNGVSWMFIVLGSVALLFGVRYFFKKTLALFHT